MDREVNVAGASEIPNSPELKLQMSDKKFEEMLQRRDSERVNELKQIGSLRMVW